MKGLVIFDQLNDIVYNKLDPSLHNHLRNLCLREGLLRPANDYEETGGKSNININALVQLFSPLVTSQRIMLNQFNNPYTAVHSQDGTIMTFSEHLGFLFLAVGNEQKESLAIVQRRLHVFIRLVNLICGPIFNSLKTSCKGGVDRQKLLNDLLDAWENLRKEELAYLIEAVERLLVNQFLGAKCVQLLETVLERVQSSNQDNVASHAFLLVNAKLLALFSSRNASELKPSDLLTLILLVHVHHPSSRIELPHSPRRSPSPSVSSLNTDIPVASQSRITNQTLGSNEKKMDLLEVPKNISDDDSSDSEAFFSPCGSPPRSENIEKVIAALHLEDKKEEHTKSFILDDLEEDSNWALSPSNEDFTTDVLFLSTASSSLTPHVVHTVKVMDGVVLIIICNARKGILSGAIIQMLDILHDIQMNKQPELGKQLLDSLESNYKKLLDGIKKIGKSETEGLMKNVMLRWDNVKKNGLSEFIKSSTSQFMTARLEAAVTSMMEILRESFHSLCLPEMSINIPLSPEESHILVEMQAHVRFSLADYADYLRIKALRNVTITPYASDFPGLVYFIHVNRANHLVTLPTMDNGNRRSTMRDKIHHMVEFTRVQLQLGHFSIIWRDNNFHYSFFLWFEDTKGEPLKPQVFLHRLRNFPPPGVLCGQFYKMLRHEGFPEYSDETIQCYELMCMHQAATPVSLIVEHVRQLAANIWDITSVNRDPVDIF